MLVIAHRGASAYEIDNSAKAISKSIAFGCKAIEVDIQACKDGLIIHHDEGFSEALPFSEFSEQELKTQHQLLNLDALFQLVQAKCCINLELKSDKVFDRFVTLLPTLSQQYQFRPEQILISAFDHLLLSDIKQALPDYPIAALTASVPFNLAQEAKALGARYLNMDIKCLRQELVDDCLKNNISPMVYTSDNLGKIHELYQMGIQGVFTNVPDKVLAAYPADPMVSWCR